MHQYLVADMSLLVDGMSPIPLPVGMSLVDEGEQALAECWLAVGRPFGLALIRSGAAQSFALSICKRCSTTKAGHSRQDARQKHHAEIGIDILELAAMASMIWNGNLEPGLSQV